MESIYESQVDPLRPNDAHGISLQLVGKDKNVLELGAASGHVTKALKALNNTVTAVERDGRFKECLMELADEVVITDLDWLDLRERLLGKRFDVVLAGDVLEHCSHPELVLLQLHDLLAELLKVAVPCSRRRHRLVPVFLQILRLQSSRQGSAPVLFRLLRRMFVIQDTLPLLFFVVVLLMV